MTKFIKLEDAEALLQAKIEWAREHIDALIDARAELEFGTEMWQAESTKMTAEIERLKIVRDTLGNTKAHLRYVEAFEADPKALEPGVFMMSTDGRENRAEIG